MQPGASHCVPACFSVFSHGRLTAADRPRRTCSNLRKVCLSWPRRCQAGEMWMTHCTNEILDSKRQNPCGIFCEGETTKQMLEHFVFWGRLEKISCLLLKTHTRTVTLASPPPPSAALWMHCALCGATQGALPLRVRPWTAASDEDRG